MSGWARLGSKMQKCTFNVIFKLGRNCIVGAGTVVLQDLEQDAVYAGVPARLINTRPSVEETLKSMKIPGH